MTAAAITSIAPTGMTIQRSVAYAMPAQRNAHAAESSVMTNLRKRIIDAIQVAAEEQTYWFPGPVVAGTYADAIIQALSLTEDDGVIVGCIHE